MIRYALALSAALLAAPAQAQDASADDLTISGAFAGATPGAIRNGAVYFQLHNRGSVPDRLVAVRTPVAASAMLHESVVQNDVMTMRHVMEVIITPGATVSFAPGGLHVMLMGLHAPLKQGESFPLTLQFTRAGEVDVEVPILKPGAREPE
jgi:copper(I)-binding protein